MGPVVVRARGRRAWRWLLLAVCVGAVVVGFPGAAAAAQNTPGFEWAPIQTGVPARSFDFGPVEAGGLVKQDFTLTNSTGKTISKLSVSLTGSTTFTNLGGTCDGNVLLPGVTCTVEIQYIPVASVQADTATLTATSTLIRAEASITLTGHAVPSKVSFTSPGCSTWPVPSVDSRFPSVTISAVGAAGASIDGQAGGSGDGVSARLSVAGVEMLDVCVAYGGGGDYSGFGGGASGVSTGSTFASPVLVAGGGGAPGQAGDHLGSGAPGGNAGFPGGSPGGAADGRYLPGGGGGTQTEGGQSDHGWGIVSGGDGSGFTAKGPGTGGFGGVDLDNSRAFGGGGGGGYYGGGGGPLENESASGGGGGSDFCTETAAVTGCSVSSGEGSQPIAGSSPGDARVTISYYYAPPGAVRSGPRCAGRSATIIGTAGGDRIAGTLGHDMIVTGSGNDRISAGRGSDLACAGTNNDIVFGGPGNDRLFGGKGNDRIFGGPGDDRITPGPGRDHVSAGAGNDRIFARDGQRDVIDCGLGHDVAILDRVDATRRCEVVIRARRRLQLPRAGLT